MEAHINVVSRKEGVPYLRTDALRNSAFWLGVVRLRTSTAVIAAATNHSILAGRDVVGIMDDFRWIMERAHGGTWFATMSAKLPQTALSVTERLVLVSR